MLAALALALPMLAPVGGAAQSPLLRLTGTTGWGFATSIGRHTDTRTTTLRLEVPVARGIAPWVSWADYSLKLACNPGSGCPIDGHIWLAGLMVGPPARERQPLRIHLGFGLGEWRSAEDHGFARSTIFGLSLDVFPVVSPTVEVRWDKFPLVRDQGVLALGLQLSVPRPSRGGP